MKYQLQTAGKRFAMHESFGYAPTSMQRIYEYAKATFTQSNFSILFSFSYFGALVPFSTSIDAHVKCETGFLWFGDFVFLLFLFFSFLFASDRLSNTFTTHLT